MQCDINDKRRAALHAILSFCTFVLTIVLFTKYAAPEIEISTLDDDYGRKAMIILFAYTIIACIWVFAASLIIIIKSKAWQDAYADVFYYPHKKTDFIL